MSWIAAAATAVGLSVLTAPGCSGQSAVRQPVTAAAVDSARAVADLRFLADPSLEGRAAGSAGNRAAREYITRRFQEAGLTPAAAGWLQHFPAGNVEGANVIGIVRGSRFPGRAIVVTAHFDHLGVRNGVVYPGADDNASGTAALLEIARLISRSGPRHSIIFAALDAEEGGLRGARAFVESPPLPIDSLVLNINLDMVGRNEAGELYAAGTYHYPQLRPLLEIVASRSALKLELGHDSPADGPADDWTFQSDHGAFHQVGIPFVYFGVEDHPDYHQPTDTFENLDPAFFIRATAGVADFLRIADAANW